jgi:hypothetical protein
VKLILLGVLNRSRAYRVIESYFCLRIRAGFHGIPDVSYRRFVCAFEQAGLRASTLVDYLGS